MNLKIVRGSTMAEALGNVRRELGADAVILHTRTYRVGGILGFGARQVVEIAASAPDRPRNTKPTREARVAPDKLVSQAVAAVAYARAGPKASPSAPPARAKSLRPQSGPSRVVASEKEIKADLSTRAAQAASAGETNTALRASSRVASTSDGGVGAPEVAGPSPAPDSARSDVVVMSVRRTGQAPPPRDGAPPADSKAPRQAASVESELAEIRRLVGQVLQSSRAGAIRSGGADASIANVGLSGALSDVYLRLLESDVAGEIAEQVLGAVRDELTPGELAQPDVVRACVLRQLSAMIPVVGDMPRSERGAGGRPHTIALVGPTGVGKTTTLAKIAAIQRLRYGRNVAMLTTDTYRIAAVEQLRMYASILGVPLRVCLSPSDAKAAMEALSGSDVVLIDTAGRSPHDADRLDDLRAFLDAARPDETHLVLAGTSSERTLLEAARAFAKAGPDRVIFTKLDEAVNFGILLNVARRVDLRLSFITTGQEVPDDIEAGRSDRLARLVLDGSLAA